jgi:hypothetical protein
VGLIARSFLMFDAPLRTTACFLFLTLATALPGVAKAPPTTFDGDWSVLIITDAGTCDASYRFGLRIYFSQFYYQGAGDVAVAGKVDAKGNVRVGLRQGDSVAQASGRLSKTTGSGRWQGASSTSRCSGRWQAERMD